MQQVDERTNGQRHGGIGADQRDHGDAYIQRRRVGGEQRPHWVGEGGGARHGEAHGCRQRLHAEPLAEPAIETDEWLVGGAQVEDVLVCGERRLKISQDIIYSL